MDRFRLKTLYAQTQGRRDSQYVQSQKESLRRLSSGMVKVGLVGGAMLGSAAVAASLSRNPALAAEMLSSMSGAVAGGLTGAAILTIGKDQISIKTKGGVQYYPKAFLKRFPTSVKSATTKFRKLLIRDEKIIGLALRR